MIFLSPIWLIALLPWGIVSVWLLWGRRKKQPVPFLPLWHGPVAQRRSRQSVRPPPVALAAMLLAMLLALLAAARPMRRTNGSRITILLDRGVTMSAVVPGSALPPTGEPRFLSLAKEMRQPLLDRFGDGPVRIVDIVTGITTESDRGRWITDVAALPRTAVDTSHLIDPAVRDWLGRDSGPIVVATDHSLPIDDARVARAAPQSPIKNVAIVAMTARENPRPQVMVRIRNESPLAAAELKVSSGDASASRRIDLPPYGQETSVFLDLNQFGDIIAAEIFAADDLDIDNRAWLAREGDWPRLEIRGTVSKELRRMADVYTRQNHPREDAAAVAIASRREELASEAGVIAEIPGATATPILPGELQVIDEPLTGLVRWPQMTTGALASPAPDGWSPLVRIGDRILVAKRELPARQVWVGFDSPQWPRSTDYVIFWTNVFNWIGGGTEQYISHPLSEWTSEWSPVEPPPAHENPWPGIYQRGTTRRAFHIPPVKLEPPGAGASAIQRLSVGLGTSREIAGWFLLAAIACVTVAAATWRRAAINRSAAEIVAGGFGR